MSNESTLMPGEILVRFTDAGKGSVGESLGPPEAEGAETQAFWNRSARGVQDVPMKVADLASGVGQMAGAIQDALGTPAMAAGSFQVDSFEIGLAVNASGKIVLVAEVGVEASITVTFKRRGGS